MRFCICGWWGWLGCYWTPGGGYHSACSFTCAVRKAEQERRAGEKQDVRKPEWWR